MTGVPLDTRVALLRQHGTFTQAYSATFQPGLEHFGDERGFIACTKVWGTTMVLSNPLAPREHQRDLIARFLREHSDVAFWQIARPVAEILAPLGFFINEMGPDNRIELASYDFTGRAKRNLRNAHNRMRKGGYTIRESSIGEVGAERVKAVSETWRRGQTVRSREVGFLSRPMVIGDEPDVRVFFMFDRAGKLIAFSVFDPIYDDGQVVGYTSQQNRYLPDSDSLVPDAIKRFAIEKFRAEGKRWLFLGLSPLANIEDKDFLPHKNWLMRRTFRFVYENALFNRFIYPVKQIFEHKKQFRASTEQTYLAFNKLPSLLHIFKLGRACNII